MASYAQDSGLRIQRKKNNATKTEVKKQDTSENVKAKESTISPKSDKDDANSSISSSDNLLLVSAIDNAFLVIKTSYNLRDKASGANISGNDFFSTVYSVSPLLAYGYGVDNRFLKPWLSDPKYDANKYGEDLASVDKIQYKRLKDKDYRSFNMNKTVSETLASGYYHVLDTSFHNLGLGIEISNGIKSGYMVWFYVNSSGETHYTISPTTITFNENTIFNVKQPINLETVIGGFFLNLNADEPGCLHLNLMGVARIDPYGSNRWELVKMQSQPTPPGKGKSAESSKSSKSEAQSDTGKKDDSIIPDNNQSKAKKSDKGKKSSKESTKSGSKDSTKSTNKSDKSSGSTSNVKSSASSNSKTK